MSRADELHFEAWQEHQALHERTAVLPEPRLEYIVPGNYSTAANRALTIEEWVAGMAVVLESNSLNTLKPPTWWLDEQDKIGRQKAKFMIWHQRYTLSRKLGIWATSPDEDFVAAGYAHYV